MMAAGWDVDLDKAWEIVIDSAREKTKNKDCKWEGESEVLVFITFENNET